MTGRSHGSKGPHIPRPDAAGLEARNDLLAKVLGREPHPRSRRAEPYVPVALALHNAATDNA